MKKRILSLFLAFVMVLGMFPINALASGREYVYLSISFDGEYIDDKNGDPIVYLPIPLETIAAVDLRKYVLKICCLMQMTTVSTKPPLCRC